MKDSDFSSQETAKTIAHIETTSELTFAKNPTKAFETLDEFERTHKDNLVIKNKIELLRKKFSDILKQATQTPQPVQEAFLHLCEGYKMIGEVEYDKGQINTFGTKDFNDQTTPMDSQTIVGIGSIGKQFTAATLLKLWDEEITSGKITNFNEGIDTKLAKFMPALKEKYPECAEKFAEMEENPHFEKITLRDLLNHTHGLGGRDNDQIASVMRSKGKEAPSFAEIINTTKQPKEDQYGKFHYSNLGCDLIGMIIETTTNKDFEDVVREKVINPNGLNNTYTTKDFANLYVNHPERVASGFAIDERLKDNIKELDLNQRSFGTRAAGGMKSTVEDLAKFAPAFMGAEMFENEEVKKAVINRDSDNAYHLAIERYPNGTLGHNGDDIIFKSRLRYNPNNGEVEASVAVGETVTDGITKKIFEKTNPQDFERLKNNSFLKECEFYDRWEKAGWTKPGSTEFNKAIDQSLENHPETRELLEKYSTIREEVKKSSPENMISKYDKQMRYERNLETFKDSSENLEQKTPKTKGAKEAEDLIPKAKSWTEKTSRSKDDSVIRGGR